MKGLALGFLLAGCMILFASAVNTLVLSLMEYWGWVGSTSIIGSLSLNWVIIDALEVVGFFFILLGIIKLLSDRTIRTRQPSAQ